MPPCSRSACARFARASKSSGGVFDEAGLKERLALLDQEAAKPELWNDREHAGQVLRDKRAVEREMEWIAARAQAVEDAEVLLELSLEEADAEVQAEVARKISRLEEDLAEAELRRLLGGPHDAGNAILSINAGAGGTDAADWAQMLFRMYERWAEAREMQVKILDFQEGDEAGIRSLTATFSGEFAYGYLKTEEGVHRLVRISPFDSQKRRHTAFASVSVFPDLDDSIEVEVDENDLRIDTYRAGGAGGQHVNKTDSAVRITHEPTGIVVQCQNERSQHKNKAQAMKVLRARIYEHARREQEAKLAAISAEKAEIGFGSQIRSYTLHPAQRVKDHRTGYEMGNAQAVLDGALDGFIRATLLWKA